MVGDLYPHQQEAVEKLRNGRILCGGVGTGKSRTAVAYYMKSEAPKDVYVITTAKKRDSLDWHREFARVNVGSALDATVAGVLHVDSWNNLGRYRSVRNAFFVFDEQRLVGNGQWSKVFIDLARRNSWILLSATPGDTWMDYIPVFIANGFYRNRTEFKRRHVVYSPFSKFPKIERYSDVGTLVKHRNDVLVAMPYMRTTTRHTHRVDVQYDAPTFEMAVKNRWNPFENRPLQDVGDLFRVMRRITNQDPTRLEAVRTLMANHPRLIVFYNFDYELAMLRQLADTAGASVSSQTDSTTRGDVCCSIEKDSAESGKETGRRTNRQNLTNATVQSSSTTPTAVTIAEWNGHKHEPIPKTDRWVYLVQYTAGAEGWNCIETDTMVFYSLPYSYKLWEQAHGRIDRLNTPYRDLHYHVLMSMNNLDRGIWRALKSKKNFNERGVKQTTNRQEKHR